MKITTPHEMTVKVDMVEGEAACVWTPNGFVMVEYGYVTNSVGEKELVTSVTLQSKRGVVKVDNMASTLELKKLSIY